MIAHSRKIQDKILDIKYGRIKQGLKLDIPEIDEHLRYKQGNFNLIIGHANSGKTTFCVYLFVLPKSLLFACYNHSLQRDFDQYYYLKD